METEMETDKVYGEIRPELLNGVSEEQKQAILNWETLQQTQMAFRDIIWSMKEIPILPSEVPPEDDRYTITKVELPGNGGVLTYMSNFEHPYQGFPYMDFVTVIDLFKKIVKGSLSGMFHTFKWNLKVVIIIPSIIIFKELAKVGIYTFYRLTQRYLIKSFRYSQAIRELYRAFSIPRGDDEKTMELRLMLRDIICMILEFDNAYRYRVQDILPELDKKALKNNPIRELNRLANLISSREKEQQVKDTWRLFKMLNSFYLRFDKKLKKIVVDVLLNLNLEKLKLTSEDIPYCAKRKDYIFGFVNK